MLGKDIMSDLLGYAIKKRIQRKIEEFENIINMKETDRFMHQRDASGESRFNVEECRSIVKGLEIAYRIINDECHYHQ